MAQKRRVPDISNMPGNPHVVPVTNGRPTSFLVGAHLIRAKLADMGSSAPRSKVIVRFKGALYEVGDNLYTYMGGPVRRCWFVRTTVPHVLTLSEGDVFPNDPAAKLLRRDPLLKKGAMVAVTKREPEKKTVVREEIGQCPHEIYIRRRLANRLSQPKYGSKGRRNIVWEGYLFEPGEKVRLQNGMEYIRCRRIGINDREAMPTAYEAFDCRAQRLPKPPAPPKPPKFHTHSIRDEGLNPDYAVYIGRKNAHTKKDAKGGSVRAIPTPMGGMPDEYKYKKPH